MAHLILEKILPVNIVLCSSERLGHLIQIVLQSRPCPLHLSHAPREHTQRTHEQKWAKQFFKDNKGVPALDRSRAMTTDQMGITLHNESKKSIKSKTLTLRMMILGRSDRIQTNHLFQIFLLNSQKAPISCTERPMAVFVLCFFKLF